MPSSSGMSGKTAAPSGTSDRCESPSDISASGHGGNDAQLVAFLDRRLQVVQVADVFIVEIDIDEATNLAVVEDAASDRRMLGAKAVEGLLHARSGDLDDGLAIGMLTHRGGDVDFDWHL